MGRNILVGSIFLQILIFVNAKSFYTLVAPETLNAGTDYSVAVTLHYNTEPSVVKVGIYGPSFNSTKTLEFSTYNIAVARFDVPKLVQGIYKLKVQGVKGMIFGNVTELKCDFDENVMEDMKQLVELKVQAGKNTTANRLGPLNLRYKKLNRRIAQDIAIDVRSNETIPYMVYALVVKGKIHSHQYLEVEGNETLEYITLSPTYDMLPHAFLYVYYIQNDTLIWNQLSMFFVKKSESDLSQNETTPKLPEGTEHILTDDVSGMTRPGEISGLITLTNALIPTGNESLLIRTAFCFLSQESCSQKANVNSLLFKFFKKIKSTVYPNMNRFTVTHMLIYTDALNTQRYSIQTMSTRSERYRSLIFFNFDLKLKGTFLKVIDSIIGFYINLFRSRVKNMAKKETYYSRSPTVLNAIYKSDYDYTFNIGNRRELDLLKQKKLESVKNNILTRLHLSKPPNIETSMVVPRKILDNFKNAQIRRINSYSQTPLSTTFDENTRSQINQIASPFTFNRGSRHNNKKAFLQRDQYSYYTNYNASTTTVRTRKGLYRYKGIDNIQSFESPLQFQQSDPLFSSLNSVYIFPKQSFLRHNQKATIFKFMFVENPLNFSRVVLHVFLRGFAWIRESQPNILYKTYTENYNKKRQMIVITVYKLYSGNSGSTHTVKIFESYHKIPAGVGGWVEIDIKNVFVHWLTNPNFETSLVVRGLESWMDSLMWADKRSTEDSLKYYIEIDADVKSRRKRSAVLDCSESGNEKRCCRYPLKINFSNFGWNFIVAPQHFDAYFCNGECNVGYLEKYTHTHIASLSSSAKPCCSPQKLNPLTLLYFDMTMKLMYSTIPNMSVEKCSCS